MPYYRPSYKRRRRRFIADCTMASFILVLGLGIMIFTEPLSPNSGWRMFTGAAGVLIGAVLFIAAEDKFHR